jgi:hypothetical protein
MKHNDFNLEELFMFGWKKTKEHYWFLLGVLAINLVLNIATSPAPFVNAIVSLLLSIATVSVLLQVVNGHVPVYKDLLKPFQNYKITWHYFLGALLIICAFALCFGVIALLFLPFMSFPGHTPLAILSLVIVICAAVYAIIRLQFFKYFIVEDENTGPIEAMKKSIAITKGQFWDLFVFLFAIAAINLIGLLVVVVGLLVTVPVTLIAYTYLYKKLSASHTHPAA